jgi:DNA invertase Pin-like site-specific DNA recombinase
MKPTQTGETRTRAIIYCRISQDRTGAHLGVDRQLEDCEALALRNGWDVVETYIDNDVSAFSGKLRKNYRRMLADLDEGAASVVISWHTDRLHRSPTELEEYINLCERRGVTTQTVQAGSLDLATSGGRLVARMLGNVARHESEHKGERVARARRQKAIKGEWTGGIRPFGWGMPTGEVRKKVDRKTGEEIEVPVLDMGKAVPEEKAAVAHGTDMILIGDSVRAFFRWLRHKGLRTSLGNEFTHPEQARDLLLRPRNAGIAISQGQEVGRGQWDALVGEDKFRACLAILTDPSRVTTPGNQPKWLGSILYRCGRGACPHFVYVTQSGGRSYPSYRCQTGHGGGRRAEITDQYVEDTIVERLSRDDAHDLLLPAPDNVDVAGLQAESEQIRQRMKDLGGLFGAGQLELVPFTEGMDTARGQLEGVTQQLARAATRDPLVGLVGAPDVRKAWKKLELDRQRNVLRALIEVTLKTPRPGRMPDGGYFDYDAVKFQWKRGAA